MNKMTVQNNTHKETGSAVLDRMLVILGEFQDKAIADYFDKSAQSVSNARNGKVPKSWIFEFCNRNNVTIDWLLKGERSEAAEQTQNCRSTDREPALTSKYKSIPLGPSLDKLQNVGKIFDAIKLAKGFRKDSELAEFVGTSKQNIFNWQKRDSIGDYEAFTKVGLSGHFMRTGSGPMFTRDKGEEPKREFGIITALAGRDDSDFDMQEMLDATRRVLGSNTVYRSVLASNVRAFDKAVKNEVEMDSLQEQMVSVRSDMSEMKELLLSLGAMAKRKGNQANS